MRKFQRLLCGLPSSLRTCTRYNTSWVHHRESVAEHSYYTVFYAMMIADYVNQSYIRTPKIDVLKVMRRATLHDIDEAISGDIVRPFKHSSETLMNEIDRLNMKNVSRFLGNVAMAPYEDYLTTWNEAKADDREGMIVAFADYLSVVSYIYHEVVELGNHSIKKSLEGLEGYAAVFLDTKYDFLDVLPAEAMEIVALILDGEKRPWKC